MKNYIVSAVALCAILALSSCTNNESEVLAVRLDKNSVELTKGESVKLNASVVPDQEADFEWFSQDSDYVTVDSEGLVTAVGLKKEDPASDEVTPVKVYVKYENGADECEVTVLPLQAQKVEILGEELVKIRQGESVTLAVKYYPEDADIKVVTWSTDYAVVAKVNKETGAVTGMEPGFATIKASYNDKVYDVVTVQVEPK